MVGSYRVYAVSTYFLLLFSLGAGRLHAAPAWLPLGPDGGDARRMVSDPVDHSHVFLGAANGWIYESHTGGASWLRLAQIGGRDDLVLDSIVVDRSNPRHLFVGAWVIDRPDGGLFVSNDGGQTWLNQAEMRGQSVRSLTASPSDPTILVAGSLSGVFRSVDSGQHWNRISPAASREIHEIQSVAVDPKDPAVIYAGTWHLPWKTTDAGEHWASIKQGILDDSDVFSIIVDPESPRTMYASACSGIYKSEDAGDLFHKIQGIPSTARRTRVLLQDPHQLSTVFAGTTEGLFRSVDAGATWTRTTGPEIIVNDVLVDRADAHHVLIATNRGGVLSSDDGGDSFHSSNGGFSARQITALQRDAAHPSTLLVGVVNDKDWGGVFQSENGGVNWVQRSEGLQGRDVFSLGQAPDGTMFAGTVHGLYRLSAAESLWQRVENAPGLPPSSPGRSSSEVPRPAASLRPASSLSHTAFHQDAIIAGKATARKPTPRRAPGAPSHPQRSSAGNKGQPSPTRKLPVAARNVQSSAIVNKSTVVPPKPLNGPGALAVNLRATRPASFDGSVYSIVTAGGTMLVATSSGLLSSADNGSSWMRTALNSDSDWRFLASAKGNVVAGGLHALASSADAGGTWSPVKLPAGLTQVSGLAVEPSGTVWVGGREGVFISPDAGNTWSTPKDIYANAVSNLIYDDATNAVTVTTAGARGIVFTVQLPQRSLSYFESGWTLRFACPMGDHLVAATLFDGMVVQPRMTISPPVEPPSKSPPSAVAAPSWPRR